MRRIRQKVIIPIAGAKVIKKIELCKHFWFLWNLLFSTIPHILLDTKNLYRWTKLRTISSRSKVTRTHNIVAWLEFIQRILHKSTRFPPVKAIKLRQIEVNFVDLAEFEYQKCAKLKKNSPVWLSLFAQFKIKLYLCAIFIHCEYILIIFVRAST